MLRYFFFFFVFIFFSQGELYAQFEGNKAYFETVLGLDFTCGPPFAIDTGFQVGKASSKGQASICDAKGNILLYADHYNIYNKYKKDIPGTIGKLDPLNNGNAQHGVMIVPCPSSLNQYYVFFAQQAKRPDGNYGILKIGYFLIDLSMNAGQGRVMVYKPDLIHHKVNQISGALTGARNKNRKEYYVFTQFRTEKSGGASDSVAIIKISATGLNMHYQAMVDTFNGYIQFIQASPDGSRLIALNNNYANELLVYDIDHDSDSLTNFRRVHLHTPYTVNAIQFSPDGDKVYINTWQGYLCWLCQFDISAGLSGSQIEASANYIMKYDFYSWFESYIGPDNNIYYCVEGNLYVGKLSNANDYKGAVYDPKGILMKYNHGPAMPNFVSRKPHIPPFTVSSYCEKQPITFTPYKNLKTRQFRWFFGDTTSGQADSSHDASPYHIYNTPGHYVASLIADDHWGMPDTYYYSFCVLPLPKHISPKTMVMCKGDTATIDAGNTGAIYAWSDGVKTQKRKFTKDTVVSVSISLGSCSIKDTVQVLFLNKPISLGHDTTLCDIDSFMLDAGYTRARWSGGDSGRYLTIKKTGTYIAEVKGSKCKISDTIRVTFRKTIKADLGTDRTICMGETTLLDAGISGYTYLWSGGEQSQTIRVSQAGTYWLKISNGGCVSRDTISIIVNPLPQHNPLPARLGICEEDKLPVVLDAGLHQGQYYSWLPGKETSSSILAYKPDVYKIKITNTYGCTVQDSTNVFDECNYSLYVPNVFSPDGNGLNDIFLPIGAYIQQYRLQIYNRWGELIFTSTDISKGWDGYYKSTICPEGVYYYQIKIVGNTKTGIQNNYYKGSFSLVR